MPEDAEKSSHAVTDPGERFRLYIDESGDHVFRHLDQPSHRFLCLLGCFFRGKHYVPFHDELERFRRTHLGHHPDEPVILHREDIINRRSSFWRLRKAEAAAAFDEDLVALISAARFGIIAILIDKQALTERYDVPAHPYHLALGFMLQRYCGLLNHLNRQGDVMAESRGGREDRLLKDSYATVYARGVWMTRPGSFQRALTSRELKLKRKSANIAGLQLADLLGHPVRQAMLIEKGLIEAELAPFASRLMERVEAKFDKQLYDGRVWGYGKVLFPA